MPVHLFIGAGAGLVSAALFASAAASSAMAMLLLYLCPLPLGLAGLGWGRAAVGVAGLAGTGAMTAFGFEPTLTYGLNIALPSVILIHLILLSRQAAGAGTEAPGHIEWYPPGRLVAVGALIAGALSGLLVLTLGPDMAGYQASIDQLLPKIHDLLDPNNEVWTPELAGDLRTVLTKALPAAFATTWLTIAFVNLWMAGMIAKASEHALRPWPDLHALEIPNIMVAAFAVALVLSFVPGIVGLIGTGFAGAILFAYMLQGLAVIHVYTLGLPFRPLLLAVLYLGILFLGWVAILIAILGLGEPLFGLRARGTATPSNPDNTTNE